jgi:hypothetical protein
MKWEHKIGIAVTCTFLCLVGAVIGLKMREEALPKSSRIAGMDMPEPEIPTPPEPIATASEKTRPKPAASSSHGNPPAQPEPPLAGLTKSGKGRSVVSAASLLGDDPTFAAELGAGKGPSATENNLGKEKNKKPDKPIKEKESTPIFTATGLTSSNQLGSTNTDIVKTKAEPSAVQPSPKEASTSGTTSSTGSEAKKKEEPAVVQNDPKKAEPTVLQLPSDPKTSQSEQKPAAASIGQTSGKGTVLSFDPAPLPPPSSLTQTNSGSSPSPTSSPSNKPAKGAQSSEPSIVSSFPDQPVSSKNTPDPKADGPAPALAPPNSIKPPDMPKLSPAPASPPSAPTPPTVTPAPMQPVLPPTTTPAPQPPSTLMTTPSAAPNPPSSPAPVAPTAPPPPPKPPADGSTFIPDRSSSAPGPVGVKPAPFPLPTPPASSPLASEQEKPAPPQPANNAPSVMVYYEQDYACQPGDTWEAISKRFYMTDRYAKALQRHNQNHARASERMKDTGQLAAGERIFVPQSYILDERHADAVVKPSAAPAAATMPAGYVPNGAPSPTPPPARPNP